MDFSINALRDHLEAFLYERASAAFRASAGLSSEPWAQRLYARFPELATEETFLEVRELAERASTDGRERGLLKLLAAFLADEREGALGAEAVDAMWRQARTPSLAVDHEVMSPSKALAAIPHTADRDRRALLERAWLEGEWKQRSAFTQRLECAPRAAETLGFPSYRALREAVFGLALDTWVEQAQAVLRETDDAYRDLLGYALKKVVPGARGLDGMRRHDLLRAGGAPWMSEHFRVEDAFAGIVRSLTEMGLPPNAEGRLLLDLDERPGKDGPPAVSALRVPQEVRLTMRKPRGLEESLLAMAAFGRAQHLAHVSAPAPVEERRLGDPALGDAFAALFGGYLLDEAWLRRFLRHPQGIAREAARMAAFLALRTLRFHCARVECERTLFAEGLTDAAAEQYEVTMSKALGVTVERGWLPRDIESGYRSVDALRGLALGARLHRVLRDRFNEDCWRNPAAGSWLKRLFARGHRDDAQAVGKELGGDALSVAEAVPRLIAVLGA
jgi:hypothetical protein